MEPCFLPRSTPESSTAKVAKLIGTAVPGTGTEIHEQIAVRAIHQAV